MEKGSVSGYEQALLSHILFCSEKIFSQEEVIGSQPPGLDIVL